MADKTIGSVVRAKQIYSRQPLDSHYRPVGVEIIRHMNASCTVDMVDLEGYPELLPKQMRTHSTHIHHKGH